jgi:hypothetical protein
LSGARLSYPSNKSSAQFCWYGDSAYKSSRGLLAAAAPQWSCGSSARACCLNSSRVTNCSAFSCVDSRITGGATPASSASFQRRTHRHHCESRPSLVSQKGGAMTQCKNLGGQRTLSPGLRPGKLYCGAGVCKSFPRALVKSRNSLVTRAQTKCRPASCKLVLQKPSRKNPVRGCRQHKPSSPPSTFFESF